MPDFIHIHPCDNVVVALRAVPAGTAYEGITARVDIPQGHKMAIEPIAEKEPVQNTVFPSVMLLLLLPLGSGSIPTI